MPLPKPTVHAYQHPQTPGWDDRVVTVMGPGGISAPIESTTLVIEDAVVRRRVHRPLDLARFLVALAVTAGIVLIAYFATTVAGAIDTDLSSGVSQLPSAVVLVLNIIGGLGTLGLPIAASAALIIRRRVRVLVEALLALVLTVMVLTAVSTVISSIGSPRLLTALAGSVSVASSSTAPILGSLVAFATVARLMGRRPWNVITVSVIGSVVIVTVLSTGIAVAGVGISLAIGWAIGLVTRYAFGTPTSRPSGLEIAAAMSRGGLPIVMLVAEETTRRGRRYRATTAEGRRLRVNVLDRDMEGAGLAQAAWAALRLRDETGRGSFNMRRTLERAALMSLAAQNADAPVPRLLLSAEVNADAVLLAYQHLEGAFIADLDDLTDTNLDDAWRALAALHADQISHRSLSPVHLLRDADDKMWLLDVDAGTVAASDVAMRIDVAELLCTLALTSDVARSVAAGRRVLGDEALSRCLPALQKVALSRNTRQALRKSKGTIVALRDALLAMRPDADVQQIRLERIRPRTLVMIIVGTVAGYVLLSQLAQVDLATLFSRADWRWLGVAFILSLVTYLGAAWSLSGFVPEKLKLHRTIAAQLAGDFATLVSPPTLGAVAINMRFLQRAGLHPALAAASVGVSQVFAFFVHIVLLLSFGIAAGTQADLTFRPPTWAVIVIVALFVIIAGLLSVPNIRRMATQRLGPMLKEVGPRLVTVAQRPLKLLEGIGGMLLLNLAYIGVLAACVEAFGGDLNLAVVAVVYLAGATLGQAAPTPGGLGAVEAALAAGLTAGGLDGGTAVSAVLAFRLVTFWLPTIPGYWAFNWLQRTGGL